jgi:hypothetical protein
VDYHGFLVYPYGNFLHCGVFPRFYLQSLCKRASRLRRRATWRTGACGLHQVQLLPSSRGIATGQAMPAISNQTRRHRHGKAGRERETGRLRKRRTCYGESGSSLFLRNAFIKGTSYTDNALDRPVTGIVSTGSAYSAYHCNAPQLSETG